VENSKEKLKLDYPCNWQYKAICESRHNIDEIAKDVLDKREHTIKESNNSKGGKYKSHTITTLVHSDDDRKTLYEEFKRHKSIKFVL